MKLTAIVVWIYVIAKLFVFDIDNYFINKYIPQFGWLTEYKLFVLICLLGLIAAILNRKQVLIFCGYIIFYPLLMLLWIIPYLIFKSKSWIFAIAAFNSVFRFFANFRDNAIMLAAFVAPALAIFLSRDKHVLAGAVIWTAILLVVVYGRAVIAVMKPDPAFRVYGLIFSVVKKHTIEHYSLASEISSIPIVQLNDVQREKWKSNLEISVISNRIFLYFASKLKFYADSNFSLIAGFAQSLVLLIVCVSIFSLANLGLYKIDPTQFRTVAEPWWSTWLYYSFKTFVASSITEITPVSSLSELMSVSGNIAGFFTLTILIGSLVSQRNSKQLQEINKAANSIESDALALEEFVANQFHLTTIDDAIAELEKSKAGLIGAVLWLSKSLKTS